MLIRSTWMLTVSEPTALPCSYGLELVKTLHQRMGLDVGDSSIPTISYSSIVGFCSSSQDFLTFQPGEFYQLSLCGLQEIASKAIAELDLTSTLTFLGATFNVINRDDDITSYETLYHSLVALDPEPKKRHYLKFITPTAFAQDRIYLPLPLPTLMFRSWLERWNHFAPVYLGGDELIAYLGGAIALSRHKIQTHTFSIQGRSITGFKGEITLQVLNQVDPLLANVANLLIYYAQFAGTGMKTRLGMGSTNLQQQRIPLSPTLLTTTEGKSPCQP